MALKQVVLQEKTRILFNQAKGKILMANPNLKYINDDTIIKFVLEKFLEVKNGKPKSHKHKCQYSKPTSS